MLMSLYTNDASMCLRCQYRLLYRNRLRKRRRTLPSPPPFSRSFAFFNCLREVQTDSKDKVRYTGGLSVPTNPWKLMQPHSKDSLEVVALGEKSTILQMGSFEARHTDITSDKLEETDGHHYIMSPSEMLTRVDEENGLVNPRRVDANMEQIKSSWFSKLQYRSGIPTVSEYNQIVKVLREGFTRSQLLHYFESQTTNTLIPPSLTELSTPFSTDLYTRSSWRLNSTAFPSKASSELVALRERLKDETITQPNKIKEVRGRRKHAMNLGTKSGLINRILLERWNLRTDEEREKTGELDIWMHQEHLDLILNHRSNMLKGLAQKYGVKVDAALPHGIIRVSGDIGTCGDIFRFLVYTLENISSLEISLPSGQSHYEQTLDQRQRFLNQSFRSQIEQLTSTVLRPVPRSKASSETDEKLRVYYLGPPQDDLEDVQRLLSQKYPPALSKHDFVLWESTCELSQVEPCPIETDQGLPLVERGTQWSRWTAGIRRGFEAFGKSKNRPYENSNYWSGVSKSIGDLLFMNVEFPITVIDSNEKSTTFWGDTLMRETSAVFGQVLYPSDSIKKTKHAFSGIQVIAQDPAFRDALGSRREFLSTFAGLKGLVSSDLDVRTTPKMEYPNEKSSQGLHIRLTPSQNVDMLARGNCVLPDLELRLDINEETRETALVAVRLISDRRQVDLLLPDEIADVRFLAESYVPAFHERIDPQITDFVKSSNLDIFGEGRLKTPTTLSLSIPRHSVRDTSNSTLSDGIRVLGPGPNIMVDYTFSSLEHRSYISNQIRQSRLEYAMIEAGKIGGRRIEARLVLQNSSKPVDEKEFLDYFLNVNGFFERFRESTTAIAPKDALSNLDASIAARPQLKHQSDGPGPRDSKSLNLESFSKMDRSPVARLVRALPSHRTEVD